LVLEDGLVKDQVFAPKGSNNNSYTFKGFVKNTLPLCAKFEIKNKETPTMLRIYFNNF